MNHIQQRASVLVGLALAITLALAGCSAPASDGSGNGTGGSDQGTPESSDSPGTGLEGYEGKPATFPADVPIIDGEVVFGVDLGTGWTVVVTTDDIDAAYADASGQLVGADFASQVSSTTDDGSFGAFDNDKYTVQVTAADSADYGPSVTYVVVLKG